MTNIIALIILIFSSYWVCVFAAPEIASKIDSLIGISWFSESIRGTKTNLDSVITDIPSASEFKSWAIDIKDKVTGWVEATKDTIDTIRSWAQQVEEAYSGALDTYNDLKGTLEEAQEKVEKIQGVVESVSQLTGSGS
jgi:predicted nuclease with TOPRIM domain